MANEHNVITLDDDERNARPLAFDSRRPPAIGSRRPTAGIVVPPSTRPTVIQAGGMGADPRSSPAPQPTVICQQAAPQASVLAGMPTAELVEIGAQILAAIQPLPGAPNAQGDVETDVENLV